MARDRAVRAADRDRAAARPPRRRARACAPLDGRVRRRRRRVGARRDPVLPAASRPREFALRSCVRRRRARAADPRRRRSGAASSTSSSASRCSSLAAGVALWVDRPEREQRSIAELLATGGALAAAAAVLARPGRGRPRRADGAARALARARLAPPRRRLDLARRADRPARALARAAGGPPRARASSSPCRASRTSRSSRCCCCSARGSGRAFEHLPTLASLWQTSYGKTVILKVGARSPRRSRSPRSTCCAPRPGARARARRTRRSLLRRLVERRGAARRGRGRRRRAALEPPAAGEGARAGGRRARARRARARSATVVTKDGYTLRLERRAERAPRPRTTFALKITAAAASRCAAPT